MRVGAVHVSATAARRKLRSPFVDVGRHDAVARLELDPVIALERLAMIRQAVKNTIRDPARKCFARRISLRPRIRHIESLAKRANRRTVHHAFCDTFRRSSNVCRHFEVMLCVTALLFAASSTRRSSLTIHPCPLITSSCRCFTLYPDSPRSMTNTMSFMTKRGYRFGSHGFNSGGSFSNTADKVLR